MTTRDTGSQALREEMVGALLLSTLETTALSAPQAVEIVDTLLPTVQRHVDHRRLSLVTRLLMEANNISDQDFETCSHCGGEFLAPVELHHSEYECVKGISRDQ